MKFKSIVLFVIFFQIYNYFHNNYCKIFDATKGINSNIYLPFEYKYLSKEILNYQNVIQDGKILNSVFNQDSNDYLIKKNILYNEEYQVIHEKNNHEDMPNLLETDYIYILNLKYSVDSLFYGSNNANEEHIITNIVEIYKFIFNTNEYIAIYLWNTGNCTLCTYNIILFDVTNKQKPICIWCGEQISSKLDCFGDFDNDNQLDFIKVSLSDKGNAGICYSLKNSKFILDNHHYLSLKIVDDYNLYIDLKKSKWFFDLKEAYPDKVVHLIDE